ncbi:MAG TPA: response regulator, partial [Sulfuricurvum sp.]|nr:response regulator [Sulfuricurvum sp.]
MRILLLEDDPVLGDIVTDFLVARYKVDHVYDAKAALSRIDGSRYDLYLFDINVPGRNGIELLRALRGEFDTTPAIFITAYED